MSLIECQQLFRRKYFLTLKRVSRFCAALLPIVFTCFAYDTSPKAEIAQTVNESVDAISVLFIVMLIAFNER